MTALATWPRVNGDVLALAEELAAEGHGPFTWVTKLAGEVGTIAHSALQAQFNGACPSAYRAEMVRLAAMALAAIECVDRECG